MSRDTSKRKLEIVDSINNMLSMFDDEYSQTVALGKAIGAEKLALVMEEFGGQKPHIPTLENFHDTLARELRDSRMRKLFHPRKYGYDRLAREFSGFMGLGSLSERHVREIIHKNQRTYKRKPEKYKPVKLHETYHQTIAENAEAYSVSMAIILQEIIDIAMKSDNVRKKLDAKFGRQMKMEIAS